MRDGRANYSCFWASWSTPSRTTVPRAPARGPHTRSGTRTCGTAITDSAYRLVFTLDHLPLLDASANAVDVLFFAGALFGQVVLRRLPLPGPGVTSLPGRVESSEVSSVLLVVSVLVLDFTDHFPDVLVQVGQRNFHVLLELLCNLDLKLNENCLLFRVIKK